MPFTALLARERCRHGPGTSQHPPAAHAANPPTHEPGIRPRLSPSDDAFGEELERGERGSLEEDRLLDPMTRHLAGPVAMTYSAPPTTSGLHERLELARAQTLEQMFPAVVRKAAWHVASDRRSATLRLEIGVGAFDGTTVLIRADLHEVHIELDAPPGFDLEAWKNRLRLRLASQGLVALIS